MSVWDSKIVSQVKRLTWRNVLAAALLLLIGAGIGYFFGNSQSSVLNSVKSIRYAGDYHFINPPLYSEVPESLAFPVYSPLKDALTKAVNDAKQAGDAADVGVYFRDLNDNKWTGVNEDHDFAPGSLIKVGTLLTALRITDDEPSRLSSPLHLVFGSQYVPASQFYPPQDPVQPGGYYTVNELLNHLIINSDNGAADALDYYFGLSELEKTLNDLDVPIPKTATDELNTPQDYSHLFRALYNGTYLSHDASEKALSLLSKTEFTDGLVAGVPSGTVVSHKFGERGLTVGAASMNELHDCGIVYFPDHPYFLCVMTKGTNDYPVLANVIKTVSQVTWNAVSKRYN